MAGPRAEPPAPKMAAAARPARLGPPRGPPRPRCSLSSALRGAGGRPGPAPPHLKPDAAAPGKPRPPHLRTAPPPSAAEPPRGGGGTPFPRCPEPSGAARRHSPPLPPCRNCAMRANKGAAGLYSADVTGRPGPRMHAAPVRKGGGGAGVPLGPPQAPRSGGSALGVR